MTFVVEASSDKPGEGSFIAHKDTAKDALLTAIDLLGQGIKIVTIVDDKGRVYTTPQFVEVFAEEVYAARP